MNTAVIILQIVDLGNGIIAYCYSTPIFQLETSKALNKAFLYITPLSKYRLNSFSEGADGKITRENLLYFRFRFVKNLRRPPR